AGDAVVFGNPEKVADELINTAEDERPRPLGDEGRVMPFSRRRVTSEGEEIWQTWFAELRADGQFEPPVLQDKLDSADVGIVDAFLSVDGLTLIFTRHAGGAGDLYWSTRRTTDDVFEGATEVPGVNTQDEERDPWLSPDGKTLFFVSNRDGELNSCGAARITRPVSDGRATREPRDPETPGCALHRPARAWPVACGLGRPRALGERSPIWWSRGLRARHGAR